ncbi:ABC transporter substrate-binding protein [Roseinatronobacter sp.]|uniref:ABC transporter substrate-binding protein n=1 Tax=Roseinatronobacter sp. TaxID=1945755 RepID=UPI0025F653FD|nr:ABC transporter substrate-binding protein [Roseibaca sp.]
MKRGHYLAATLLAAAAMAGPSLAQEGEITIVLSEELDLVDPCMATRSNIGRVVLQNISETLTELDVRGDRGVMPRLAESWEMVDANTWRFTLRDGVTFSDGSAFDAGDVVHSFARTQSDANSCEISRYYEGIDMQLTAVDDLTLDIRTEPAQPIMPLLMTLLTIVPSETGMEFTRDPIGTGPYRLAEWNVGQNIRLERRDDYWGEAPEVSAATYVFRSEPSVRAAMVQTGEAHIAPSISALEATNAATDFSYPNSETTYLRIDQMTAPFGDVRVRQAMNMAIDREAFIGTILPAGVDPAVAMVVPTTLGWNSDLTPAAYDPDGARALLAEAAADGVPVDTEFMVIGRIGNFPGATEVYEAITAMLTDVGFNARLQMVEVAEHEQFYSRPYVEGTPYVIGAQHDNSRGDPVFSMYFKYHSEGRQSGVYDQRVDDLIDRATAATGDARAALWSELFALLHDEILSDVLLFHMVGFARVSETVDFTPTIATNSSLQLSEIGLK